MPERNLVVYCFATRSLAAFAVVAAAFLQTGCSQMKPMGLSALGGRPIESAAKWEVEKAENLERMYEQEPEEFEPLTVESAVAAGQAQLGTELPEIELSDEGVPRFSEPRLKAIAEEVAANKEACAQGQCDHPGCNPNRAEPKLPHAEPVQAPRLNGKAPPAAVVSQPLSPIEVAKEDRITKKQVQTRSKQPDRRSAAISPSNTNRYAEKRVAVASSYSAPAPLPEEKGRVIHLTSRTANDGKGVGSNRRTEPDSFANLKPTSNDVSAEKVQSAVGEELGVVAANSMSDAIGQETNRSTTSKEETNPKRQVIVDPAQFASTSDEKAEALDTAKQFPVERRGPELSPPSTESPPADDHLVENAATGMAFNDDPQVDQHDDFDATFKQHPGSDSDRGTTEPAPASNASSTADLTESNAASETRFSDLTDEEFQTMFGINVEPSDAVCPGCGQGQCTCTRENSSSNDFQVAEPKLSSSNAEAPSPDSHIQLAAHTEPVAAAVASGDFQPGQPENSTFASSPALATSTDFSPIEVGLQPTTNEIPNPDIISKAVGWQSQVIETMEMIQRELTLETDAAKKENQEIKLRLLDLLQRNIQVVVNHQPTTADRQDWEIRLDAIMAMLPISESDSQTRSGPQPVDCRESLACLRKVVSQLESLVGLRLKNASFCTEVKGFGEITSFPNLNLRPIEKVLVYCEVENYVSEEVETADAIKHLTRLLGSFSIANSHGQIVQQGRFPVIEDLSLTKRRDFYVYFPIEFANLPPGEYRLLLEVEDLTANSQAAVEPSLKFQVK